MMIFYGYGLQGDRRIGKAKNITLHCATIDHGLGIRGVVQLSAHQCLSDSEMSLNIAEIVVDRLTHFVTIAGAGNNASTASVGRGNVNSGDSKHGGSRLRVTGYRVNRTARTAQQPARVQAARIRIDRVLCWSSFI